MIIIYNIPGSKKEALKILGYDNINVTDGDDVKDYSAYGTPIFMPINLGDSTRSDGIIEWKGGRTNQMKILCAVIEISNTRNIVKTEIQGRDGSVKEFINNGDYQISIKGILSNDVYTPNGQTPTKGNNKYPMDAVSDLHAICKAPTSIPIENNLLYQLGIYDIVIEDFSLIATPGKENIQAFQLNCLSDRNFFAKENDNDKLLKG